MKLRDAMTKAIREYYSGQLPEKAIEESGGEFKYTLEFFEKMNTAKPEKAKTAKKGKEAKDEE